MDYSRLVKLNQGLLTGTAIFGLGSVVAGILADPSKGIASVAFGAFTSLGINLGTNRLEALVNRFRNSSDVLRNEDLAKAAGRTVGKTLLEKVAPDFPDIEKQLNALANKTEGYWVEWAEQAKTLNLFESLQEQQLVKIFSTQPDQFTQYQVLTLDEWQEVVTWLFETGCEKRVLIGTVDDYQDVILALAQELATHFNKYKVISNK